MNDLIFADIEIESTQGQSAPFLPSQPIVPRAVDPVREKFYSMRRLSSERPFARSDSELFYKQARFMEDFTDTYEGDAKFNMYYPYYQHMGYDYLRTYFTWRTKVRSGEMNFTSLSYVFLYIYELLSGIGVENPEDGLNKLVEVWRVFSSEYTAVSSYLPKWFKDYFVFYEMPQSFQEFVEEHSLQKHYSLTFMFDASVSGQLMLWNNLSGYDVTKSKFYSESEENKQVFSRCFDAVIASIQDFCTKRNARFEDLLIYSVSRRSPWLPFKHALFGSRVRQTDREIHISSYERYFCKNGAWTANTPIYYSSQKDFVGYIIKKTEACLRMAVNYKYKLAVEMKPGSKPFRELQRPAAKRADLDKVIEKAVADFYQDINRVAVTVDTKSLARIREEALETQDKLIVEEGENRSSSPLTALSSHAERATSEPLTLSFADGWKALKKALSETELKALSVALNNSTDIKAYADEANIMLEVLADGINEKASDCIGDSLLELDGNDMIIFDEYRDNILSILSECVPQL
ncbi:MAG: TerB N-terminal domain-containing protein [Oscillospiraceae bacterium]|nr:TerB N-terminal domain-containing protein [Oscillospiraceae bacterium]